MSDEIKNTQPGADTSNPIPSGDDIDQDQLQDMIAEADTGARSPSGIPAKLLWWIPLIWAIFQLYIASPVMYMTGITFNSGQSRAIHLAFALFLAFTAYPATKRSPKSYIPIQDWVWAILGACSAGYLYVFSTEVANRLGDPNTPDLVLSLIGMVLLLEATRRALGPPLMVVAAIFMIYAFGGPYMPEVIEHKGASFAKGMSHYWLTPEGVFGVALGVSTSMVFLFVLFGSLLERAGAGNYFIRVAFALLGHMRGGPAKAAVVSSGMTGLVSGSSIANVVTTGTFTIPLMRKVGFSPEKAGAVEVASSTNGQLTPPVMGAAAFLMVEFVGISYIEVIKHAFLPAIISYAALVYIVHLEALKANMQGLPPREIKTWQAKLFTWMTIIVGLIVTSMAVYYGLGWIKDVAGAATPYIATVLLVIAYLALAWYAAQYPPLDTSHEINELPLVGPTVKSGLYFLLPVVVLVWCLTVERLSPGLSAFWAAAFMSFIVFTQKRVMSYFRNNDPVGTIKEGWVDLLEGCVTGSRNMIGIGVATAAAGIIVGTVTLTGIGQQIIALIELVSGGNLMLILIFTAVTSLVLGMGLPTTANYIVVSSLMAPVIVTLGAQNGLIVPLIAAHMFVFYFGILADDTPPVGLAAFAAAAISGGDPIKTGLQGFAYDIRTAILPFLFIFNTELLLIGVNNILHGFVVFIFALVAMMVFAAATQGYFLTRSKIWETAALLLIAFTLFRPGFWMDMVYPPLTEKPASEIYAAAEALPDNAQIRIRVKGETLEGEGVDKVVMLPVGPKADGKTRMAYAGLELRDDGGKMIVDNIVFGSTAEKQKIDFDWEIVSTQVKTDRPPKQVVFIPAFILLGLIIMVQRSRRRKETPPPSPTVTA